MNFIEMADAVTEAKKRSKDADVIRTCDEVVEKLVWLAYRAGDLVKKDEEKEPETPFTDLVEEKKEEKPEEPLKEDGFSFLYEDAPEDSPARETPEAAEPAPEPEPEEKPFGPTVPEVKTPSFLESTIEKNREEKEPTMDDLLNEAKSVNDPLAAQYAEDLKARMEVPEQEKPKEEAPKSEPEAPVPAPQPEPKKPAFKEEKVKYLGTFQYDQMAMTINSQDNTKHDEIIVTVYPLTAEKNVSNAPIFVVLSSPKDPEPVFASSYQMDKGNIIRASIDGHDLMVYAEMRNGAFQSQVMLTGKSMENNESINMVQHKAHNPNPEVLGNGHIKFAYDAGTGVTGQIEVFPFGPGFVYIHKVENFCDMRQYGSRDVAIQTADGRMMQVAIQRKDQKKGQMSEKSIVSADLVPYEAG